MRLRSSSNNGSSTFPSRINPQSVTFSQKMNSKGCACQSSPRCHKSRTVSWQGSGFRSVCHEGESGGLTSIVNRVHQYPSHRIRVANLCKSSNRNAAMLVLDGEDLEADHAGAHTIFSSSWGLRFHRHATSATMFRRARCPWLCEGLIVTLGRVGRPCASHSGEASPRSRPQCPENP